MHIDKSLVVRPSSNWLRGLRAYFVTIAVGNFFWESAQLPLYTIWHTGTARELVFAVIHCLIGDLLIALSALMLALFIAGNELWPTNGYRRIVALALIFGVA